MAAKRPHRTRPIFAKDGTWPEREAAAKAAGVEFIVDLDGPGGSMHWVIKRRETGEIVEHCKGVHQSEIDARVSVLNRGRPTVAENVSWGKLKKEGARREPGRKYPNPTGLTTTQWVERLYADPQTNAILREFLSSKASLKLEILVNLLATVDEAGRDFPVVLLEAISMQLYKKFGVHRAEETERR